MKITPEIKSIQNAYMKARSENDKPEMARLKAQAMAMMNKEKKVSTNPEENDKNISVNKDGDLLILNQDSKKVEK
jgi:hypothetical protein